MLSMLVYFSSAQLAQSQAVAPPALLPLLHVTMKEQKTIHSCWWQLPRLNSHSHALNSHSHPIPIPWLILHPFPWDPWDPSLPHSHAHLYTEADPSWPVHRWGRYRITRVGSLTGEIWMSAGHTWMTDKHVDCRCATATVTICTPPLICPGDDLHPGRGSAGGGVLYAVFDKKGDTILIVISLSNLHRFSKFFHCLILR